MRHALHAETLVLFYTSWLCILKNVVAPLGLCRHRVHCRLAQTSVLVVRDVQRHEADSSCRGLGRHRSRR